MEGDIDHRFVSFQRETLIIFILLRELGRIVNLLL